LFELARQLHLIARHRDPTLDIVLPPRTSATRTRPLDDDEESLGRVWSRHTLAETRAPALWALGQATATTSEMPHIRVRDLRLDDGQVWLHGSRKRDARLGRLTSWGTDRLRRRVEQLDGKPDALLVFGGDPFSPSGQAAVGRGLYMVLVRAGLADDPGLRPASLSAWAGRKVFEETGQIEAAARVMGLRSLDQAARLVGWGWR
jgi:integrase/recombinase XerC